MKLLVIVLCLLSERYLIHRFSYDRFYWFNHYFQKISRLSFVESAQGNQWLLLFLLLFPLLLFTTVIIYLFQHWLFGLVGFIFNIAIFYYCLGPVNPFYPLILEGSTEEEQVGHYFYQINRQLFAPILWFMVTGPIGVLTYRLITLCQDFPLVSSEAKRITDILEWIPLRITAFLCMLVGNFQQGLIPFKHLFFSNPYNNYAFMGICAIKSLQAKNEDVITVPLAQITVNHALIVLLVILSLCVNIV